MIVIRPMHRKEQDIFAEISCKSLLGMTNLPHNREQLLEKIILSETSFLQNIQEPG